MVRWRKKIQPPPKPDYAKILDLETELGIRPNPATREGWLAYCHEQRMIRMTEEK